jgi:asparagine synthetase B (glutamine-hydrolysing)
MCGIFGIIAHSNSKISPRALESATKKAFKESERRGKDSSGAMAVNSEVITIIKSSERSQHLIRSGEFKSLLTRSLDEYVESGKFTFFGHTRMATHGSSEVSENNQPVISNQSVVLHNGIIVNLDEIYGLDSRLKKSLEVDSEAIPLLIDHFKQDKFSESDSVEKATKLLSGANTFMYMNSKSNYIHLYTSNGSLYIYEDDTNEMFLFASEKQTLLELVGQLDKETSTNMIYKARMNSPFAYNLLSGEIFKENQVNAVSENLNREIVNLISDSKTKNYPLELIPKIEGVPQDFFIDVNKIEETDRCRICLLPKNYPFITFDVSGICSFCVNYEHTPTRGLESFLVGLNPGESKKYLVPISGGRDSCYTLHVLAKELNLNVVAYTYDWGFVTDLARKNISRMCGELGVEHILVAADLKKKRRNVEKNVSAWLRKPNLGMVPLFMAGDKDFFKFASKVKYDLNLSESIFGMTRFEPANFKTGLAGVNESDQHQKTFDLRLSNKLKLAGFYASQAVLNPSYINSSILDYISGYRSYYFRKMDYLQIFDYLDWNEKEILHKLISVYGWETSSATSNTWRIGDASAPFYNFIYKSFIGFTENDVYLSNLIRDGQISREQALKLLEEYNFPDEEGFKKYCNLINLSPKSVAESIIKSRNFAEVKATFGEI